MPKPVKKPVKKILIVDDDASIRDAIRLALEEQDYLDIEVIESSTVVAGIAQMEAMHPDIVILDLHMPDKNGFDFLDMLHSGIGFANTKVIMLTADDTLANVFKAESKGIEVFYFLAKPFNISELQGIVLGLCLPSKAIDLIYEV